MVRASKVGKPRPFMRGLLLTIFTFGIYGIYWQYKAHDEVFKQFELEDDDRNEGIIWFILGLVVFSPLLYVYHWIFVSNINYLQDRLGLRKRITPGQFIAFILVPGLITLVGAVIVLSSPTDPDTGAVADAGTSMIGTGVAVVALGVLLALILLPMAFARLQNGINEIWTAYDSRMAELTGRQPSPADDPPGGSEGPATGDTDVPGWAAGAAGSAAAGASESAADRSGPAGRPRISAPTRGPGTEEE